MRPRRSVCASVDPSIRLGTRSPGRDKHPRHAVPDETGLLLALDLEGEAGDDLIPTVAFLVDGDALRFGADAGVAGDRGGEADLVPAIVDAEGEAGGGDQFLAEAVDGGEGEVAVGDRGAVGALELGPFRIDMDPLVVAGELGKGVDVSLGNRAPPARPDLLADQGLHPLDSLYLGCHRRAVYPALSRSTSRG